MGDVLRGNDRQNIPEGFDVVFQDEHLIVLNKPSGLLAVPGRGPDLQDCLSARVQAAHPEARIVHRLDRDTSGLLLMALSAEMQRELGRLFEERQVEKQYIAIVSGRMPQSTGSIDFPLVKDFEHPPRYKVDAAVGRPSQTDWRLLAEQEDRSRLEVSPVTGRSHQIRVHLSAIGHAILGDNLYADDAARSKSPRLLLHAQRLTLVHPATGERMTWHVPCPF